MVKTIGSAQTVFDLSAPPCEGRDSAPGILAPSRESISYAVLRAGVDRAWISPAALRLVRGSRIAVALPDESDAAVAMLALMTWSTCAWLSPRLESDACRKLAGQLRIDTLAAAECEDGRLISAVHPGYDLFADFVPIGRTAHVPHFVGLAPAVRAQRIPKLVANARAHSRRLSFVSFGDGHFSGIAVLLLIADAHIQPLAAPYGRAVRMIADVVAGRIDMSLAPFAERANMSLRGHCAFSPLSARSTHRLRMISPRLTSRGSPEPRSKLGTVSSPRRVFPITSAYASATRCTGFGAGRVFKSASSISITNQYSMTPHNLPRQIDPTSKPSPVR